MNRLLFLLAVGGLALPSPAVARAVLTTGHGPAWDTVPPAHALLLPLAHGADDHHPATEGGTDDKAGAPESGWGHFIRWAGHFHPPMTAFPIAMLVAAALAEALLLTPWGPEWLRGGSRWCVIVGAVGAVIAAPLGWAFATEHGGSRLLETHRWLGTATGAAAAAVLVLSELSHRSPRAAWRNAFRTVLFLAVPLVLATGFFGGAMVYGLRAYNWNAPRHADEPAAAPGHAPGLAGTRPAGGGNVVNVSMTDDDAFKPASITIPVGTTVRWTNASKDAHTVTDDAKVASDPKDVALPAGARAFNSGKIKPGGTFEQTFTVPGTYKYVCEPHEEMDMKGTIVVKSP